MEALPVTVTPGHWSHHSESQPLPDDLDALYLGFNEV